MNKLIEGALLRLAPAPELDAQYRTALQAVGTPKQSEDAPAISPNVVALHRQICAALVKRIADAERVLADLAQKQTEALERAKETDARRAEALAAQALGEPVEEIPEPEPVQDHAATIAVVEQRLEELREAREEGVRIESQMLAQMVGSDVQKGIRDYEKKARELINIAVRVGALDQIHRAHLKAGGGPVSGLGLSYNLCVLRIPSPGEYGFLFNTDNPNVLHEDMKETAKRMQVNDPREGTR
jgi:hypothetical protein